MFTENPFNTQIRTHKLSGKLEGLWDFKEVHMLFSDPSQSCAKGSFFVYITLMMALLLFGCSPKHMVTMDTKPPLVAKPDMALLIIVRTTSMYGGGEVFDNYLDGKMIGQTAGKGYFMTDIAPGSHYIMAHAQNWVECVGSDLSS